MVVTVNDRQVDVGDKEEWPLLWVLRDVLGLTGTKYGCGIGICGACTVLVEGAPLRACVTPVQAVAGREIRTIEGLADAAEDGSLTLHPVQAAFVEHQVPQCGWCMSGQIMSAVALLESNPTPTQDEIELAMEHNYCRCGCYQRIRQAVASAAAVAA